MRTIATIILAMALLAVHEPAAGKVDLVTLPKRDMVQLTIYNSADLTLARERRDLTLKNGLNRLQFSWANTLIDPTSLDMMPKAQADKIDIFDLTFPSGVKDLGVWHLESQLSGKIPVEINYLTSGLSWRAFYMGTLDKNETTMRLQGYVRVTNNSGEDYENAQVRLLVGKINLVDQIAELARRKYPYGRPGPHPRPLRDQPGVKMESLAAAKRQIVYAERKMAAKPKEIKKEGLSEYFLYSIEGRETIPNGWSKRLPSFDTAGIAVVNLYKFEEERYGRKVVRFLSFKNDKQHYLGETPIPGGILKVYRHTGQEEHLIYEGQSRFKYIPVGEKIALDLGSVQNVIVKPRLMDYRTERYLFDQKGNISGWDEIREYHVEISNSRGIPVKVEVTRNLKSSSWDLRPVGEVGRYEKIDLDTVRFTVELDARKKKELRYILTTNHGKRAQ
ncbi:DUF4139 domain-containing protein [Thermodesulfobacteriota bacterium]